jgi:glycosyltransferase involved in cell wall biosynthesis
MELFNRPLVSFIVPCYNNAKYIKDCLDSIVAQTYRPLEVVVCENGSTDGSGIIISEFEKIPWFKCQRHGEKLGTARAFNFALKEVTGEWVAKLDGDDIDKPDHIDRLMNGLDKSPDADMLYGDLEEINAAGKVIVQVSGCRGQDHIFNLCSIAHATTLIKKSVLNELGGCDEAVEFSEDWELMIRIVKAGKKCVYVGKTGHQWRRVYDGKSMSIKFGINSEMRRRNHSYIFRKHGLQGPCGCGCGVMP